MNINLTKINKFNELSLPVRVLTTWFGFGLIKPAPGTWGSLGGLLCFYGLYSLSQSYGIEKTLFANLMLALSIFLFFVGIDMSNQFERITKIKDCSHIVIDEVAALWIVLINVLFAKGNFWVHGILAFLLFRFFDIVKPFPIRFVEKKFKGGLGVMLDDMVAAVFAIIAFWCIGYFTREFFR